LSAPAYRLHPRPLATPAGLRYHPPVQSLTRALIITDGDPATTALAARVGAALPRPFEPAVVTAAELQPEDLLPAEVFFIGCAIPGPPAFGPLEKLLRHINLAGRRCGVFTPGPESAAAYLRALTADCEAAVSSWTAGGGDPLEAWAKRAAAGIHLHTARTDQTDRKETNMDMNTNAATRFDLDACMRKVKDFPKKGILFYDITSVLAQPRAFKYCLDAMAEAYRDQGIDAVGAVEARGFVLAAPFADRFNVPLVLIRKKGKLPGTTVSRKYALEYGEAEIEIHPEDVTAGARFLLVDDLIATGGTLKAARDLLESSGATVAEIFGIVGLPFLGYEKVLAPTRVRTLINYQGE